MPSSKLWGLSTKGNVYNLSTDGYEWQQIQTRGQKIRGFKKIAGTSIGAWGLGCDHQVFVYIESSDLPIRCQVSSYENERWVPTRGWSGNHLLPVDPWKWSNQEGDVHLPKEDFKLPSNNWEWESDWVIDENVQGQITDKGGWRYGILDFQHVFTHHKSIRSCVRRRKWIRYYRYSAMDRWTRINSIHLDPLEEPIVDLSVGGQSIPNHPQGFVSVWVTTIDGRVLHRGGVHNLCPEGASWQEVPVSPEGQEVLSVSVGPTGLVWAATWSGDILVRIGVDWQHITGTSWVQLASPGPQQLITNMAVGTHVVWAVTSKFKVWFRKGIEAAAGTEEGAVGSGWLEMVSPMTVISTGPGDQVWGIDYDSRQIHYRTGVSSEELSGRTWRPILLPHASTTRSKSTSSVVSSSSYQSSMRNVNGADASGDYFSESYDNQNSPDLTYAASKDIHTPVIIDEINAGEDGNEGQADLDSAALAESSPSLSPDSGTVESANTPTGDVENIEPGLDGGVLLERDPPLKPKPVHSRRDSNGSLSSNSSSIVDFVWDYREETQTKEEQVKDVTDSAEIKPTNSKRKKARDFFKQVKGFGNQVGNQVKGMIETVVSDESKYSAGSDVSISFSKAAESSSTTPAAMKLQFKPNQSASQSESRPGETLPEKCPEGVDMDKTLVPCDGELVEQSVEAASLDYDLADVESQWSDCEPEMYSRYQAEPDLVEIEWSSVSGTACRVPDENSVRHWFSSTTVNNNNARKAYHRLLSHCSWRKVILDRLQERNSRQQKTYKYEFAIDKSGWSKKGKMKWWRDIHRGHKWVDCEVELTQDTAAEDMMGSFSVDYKYRNNPKNLLIELQDIVCVSSITDRDRPGKTVFGIYLHSRLAETKRLPVLKFTTPTEEDREDWISSLSVACCEHRGLLGAPTNCAVWAVTKRGDVFVHEAIQYALTELSPSMFWHQVGGHMEKVETSKCGVTWAIGHNSTAWVYTGGYGGGFFKGLATSPHGINSQSDVRIMEVYENQRWRPVKGYTDRVILTDCYMWSDVTGQKKRSKEDTKLLSKHWSWVSEWTVDHRITSGTDKEGWQYANSIRGPFTPHARFRSVLRRRKWIRKCQLVTTGPWLEVGPLPILDVSIQLDHKGEGPVALWAVGSNGDVLCRVGVTTTNPKGQAWHHVPTDQPFQAISVGGDYRVWAIARDGSAWFRNGVTAQNLSGACWFHVPPPRNVRLTSISAGSTHVWTVDSNCNLWFRQDITPTFPEGTAWTRLFNNVQQVSIGPRNQVWMTLDGVSVVGGTANGVITRRVPIPTDNPKEGSYDYGIGGGWSYVSNRGWLK